MSLRYEDLPEDIQQAADEAIDRLKSTWDLTSMTVNEALAVGASIGVEASAVVLCELAKDKNFFNTIHHDTITLCAQTIVGDYVDLGDLS